MKLDSLPCRPVAVETVRSLDEHPAINFAFPEVTYFEAESDVEVALEILLVTESERYLFVFEPGVGWVRSSADPGGSVGEELCS